MRPIAVIAGVLLQMTGTLCGAVLDRVAVTVGKDVITESEVMEEIRLTDFENQAPLDLGPAARRAAAERLVDQALIRDEMQLESFAPPSTGTADRILRQFKKAHFHNPAQYQAALAKYSITESELKQHLEWQAEAVRYTDQRFRGGAPPPVATTVPAKRPSAPPAPNEADRTVQHAARSAQPPAPNSAATPDQQLDAWLKQARSQTKVQFHEEAFQ